MISQMTLAPFEAALERAHDGPDVERENDEAEESAEFKTHGNDSALSAPTSMRGPARN
ncbi:MAG: hypothetical protein P8Y71_16255 [Pseudolabrys sp.]